MDKKVKQLTWIRNGIIAATILLGFVIWTQLPDMIKNTPAFHIGSGEYSSKYGALILLLLPFISLFPNKDSEEIHTDNPDEREKLLEQKNLKEKKFQIMMAVIFLIIVTAVMSLGVLVIR